MEVKGVRGCFGSGCGKLEADESSAKLRVWKVVLDRETLLYRRARSFLYV